MKLSYRLATLWTFLAMAWGTLWTVHPPATEPLSAWPVCSTFLLVALAFCHWAYAPLGDQP